MGIVEGYVSGKLLDGILSTFKKSVIERWARRRAEQFVQTFCDAVANGDAAVCTQLDELLDDELYSEILFDAYRRVSLSASPVIGPRIIALLTAKLVSERRRATTLEERVLAAAEQLSDQELQEATECFEKYVRDPKNRTRSGWRNQGYPEDSAGVDLWEDWGSWAGKLGGLGFISVFTRPIPQEILLDGKFEPKVATDMYYSDAYGILADLVSQASNKTDSRSSS